MFKYIVAVLLLGAGLQLVAAQDLFLSPPYPPTAFYEQYYEVRFRVRGLSLPSFTFTNLPNFFSGSADGVLSGTPNITGTFKFTVAYTDGTNSGSDNVVVSITDSPNTAASQAQSKAVVALIVEEVLGTWIYRCNDAITIQLSAKNGHSPITWNYKNLPAGLKGDNSGLIKGAITVDGLYSFSATVGDSKGQNAESFYTLNIQPGTLLPSNNILSVPDRNVGVVYNLEQVKNQQIAADTAVANALRVVNVAKAELQAKQSNRAKSQLALNLAANQEIATEATVAKAQGLYDQSVEVEHRAQANLNTAKNVVQVATTAYNNAVADLKAAQAAKDAAEVAFNAAAAAFKTANEVYSYAETNLSQALNDYNNAAAAYKDAQNANAIAWTNVQIAKAALDVANNKLTAANQDVTNAKNNVGLATQANDDAQTNLNVADAALTAAQHTLEDANKLVTDLRGQLAGVNNDLGVANFNLTQALNNLFVAQAAKEASDKAVSIAFAEGGDSLNLLKGQSTYIFEGCTNQVYPSISGTASVSTLVASGARLNSGHVLTWGDCTSKTISVVAGEVYSFVGTIKNGVISAQVLSKA